jgi:pimeloyl-ACP methyl ester carboxylesterase
MRVFLISGLGADERLFRHLNLDGFDVVNVLWINPLDEDTLATYATRLIAHYHITDGAALIGVSLGGMLAVEIAKQLAIAHIILISTIKTRDEMPWYFKLFKALPVYRLIPARMLNYMGHVIEPFFGKIMGTDSHLFNHMLKTSDPYFLKWAMRAILSWDNVIIPPHLHHFIGDKDLVFSHGRVKNASVIKGGNHLMVFIKGEELSAMIRQIFNS